MAAVEDGDDLVLTGSKIWTTHAAEANWMFVLVRTSRTGRKQEGITFILVDMTSPGIEVQPLVMASGEQIQAQVFFDGCAFPRPTCWARSTTGGRSRSTCSCSSVVAGRRHRRCR